ncbi:hypothetical protein RM780_03925 [Streptomyces sp. DSM 44917]|uniref:Uncharacterized protein n=1 Tax=Streptomyces boetiae TaxID=3075541 RepID=A0ABU2L3H0_9ACTN|nr:hypothetical protein [Streptomyces sp. DSM 44917]MDT0306111.1 hypothetical protein [Streptomyces sp. DSM 44917]
MPRIPTVWQRIEKAGEAFARSAQPGRPYYVIDTLASGPDRGTEVVTEIRFTKKPLVGLMSGSHTPKSLWMQYGGRVYDDRGHRELRNLPTVTEMAELAEKIGAQILGSPGWDKAVGNAAVGTGFHATR